MKLWLVHFSQESAFSQCCLGLPGRRSTIRSDVPRRSLCKTVCFASLFSLWGKDLGLVFPPLLLGDDLVVHAHGGDSASFAAGNLEELSRMVWAGGRCGAFSIWKMWHWLTALGSCWSFKRGDISLYIVYRGLVFNKPSAWTCSISYCMPMWVIASSSRSVSIDSQLQVPPIEKHKT